VADFDFSALVVDQKNITQLATLEFTEAAHNTVLVGMPGTGQTHLATVPGVSGINPPLKACAVLFHGRLGQRTRAGKGAGSGWPNRQRAAADGLVVILDEPATCPSAKRAAHSRFHLLSKRYAHTSVVIVNRTREQARADVFGDIDRFYNPYGKRSVARKGVR